MLDKKQIFRIRIVISNKSTPDSINPILGNTIAETRGFEPPKPFRG
jgi:hypothetical protein